MAGVIWYDDRFTAINAVGLGVLILGVVSALKGFGAGWGMAPGLVPVGW